MKRTTFLFACIITIALTVFCSARAQTSLNISPAAQSVAPGGTFTLGIMVSNVSNLHLYHVVVHFDNTIIRCDAVTNGGFFPGTFFFCIPPVLPSDTARFVTVDDALTGTQTRSGSGRLFSLRFTALREGVSPVVMVEVVLRDGLNQNVACSITDGSVTVTSQSVNAVVHIERNWNLISVPLIVSDYRTSVLYPTANSSAFRFQSGYIAEDTLQNGTGYWLKFPDSLNVTISGSSMPLDTIDVLEGWNIIGSVSDPVVPSQVVAVPPVTILTNFFGYRSSSGYFTPDTLKPGGGYWVKVSSGGQLVIQSGQR